MAVMSSGDIVVGSKPSARKPEAVIVRNLDKNLDMGTRAAPQSDSAPVDAERRCVAMSQQRSDSGATSMPQKFVHLVGCRDSKAGGQKKR
jgi:hypothetical protein